MLCTPNLMAQPPSAFASGGPPHLHYSITLADESIRHTAQKVRDRVKRTAPSNCIISHPLPWHIRKMKNTALHLGKDLQRLFTLARDLFNNPHGAGVREVYALHGALGLGSFYEALGHSVHPLRNDDTARRRVRSA